MGRPAPNPTGQGGPWLHWEEEEEEETGSGRQLGITPAPAVFPSREGVRCRPDSACSEEPDFKCGGAATELLFLEAWRAAGGTEPAWERPPAAPGRAGA